MGFLITKSKEELEEINKRLDIMETEAKEYYKDLTQKRIKETKGKIAEVGTSELPICDEHVKWLMNQLQ